MVITPDAPNKRIQIQFTNDEWSTLRHLTKVFGIGFFQNHLERFLTQRSVQRLSRRKEMLGDRFAQMTTTEQNQILTIMGVNFDDE